MADALCGPSNALQSFQKHTSVDRTLQQDRLRTLPTPAQGFRSPDPRTGSLDADFAAFEAGQPFRPLQPVLPEFSRQNYINPPNAQPSFGGNSSWATDFQNLRLSGPSAPIPQAHFRAEAPLHRSQPGPAGWHAEFIKQQQQIRQSPAVASTSQTYSSSHYALNSQVPMPNGYAADQYAPEQLMQNVQPQDKYHGETGLDQAAFEDAFALAESEQAKVIEEAAMNTTSFAENEQAETFLQDGVEQSEDIRIGSDLIEERSAATTEEEQKAEADELARTAGDLLNALKHERNDKFQQSQFLSLMRRIRDREVEVQGEDLKEINHHNPAPSNKSLDETDAYDIDQALHPGGPYYPEHSQRPSSSSSSGLHHQTNSSMTGALTADDLDQFDQISESPTLAARFGGAPPPPASQQISNNATNRPSSFQQPMVGESSG